MTILEKLNINITVKKKIEYDFDNSIKKNDDVDFLSYKDFKGKKTLKKS